jgi:uncharacterized protein (DUF58 family)
VAQAAAAPSRLRERLGRPIAAWARRRTGRDRSPVLLDRRRIYILPTRLGLVYGLMLFTMLLAGLNYANNLALALTFILAAAGWVAMHECYRNLAGLSVVSEDARAPFAGHAASLRYTLVAKDGRQRQDIELGIGPARAVAAVNPSATPAAALIEFPCPRRGRLILPRMVVESRYPLGIFRAWSWLHFDQQLLVYPAPAAHPPARPPAIPDGSSRSADTARGDEDVADLRTYRRGDALRRVAWKAYARGGALLVRELSGTGGKPPYFDLATVAGADLESRLSALCRLVVDAAARGDVFGLRLGDEEVQHGSGPSHLSRCLEALAVYGLPA